MAKKVITANPAVQAVFSYTSECCKVRAKKPPVERSASDRASKEYSQCGLGIWRCSTCENRCKVKRSRIKESDGAQTGTPASERT